MLAIRDETFDGTFPFAPHYWNVDGFAMHYVDEGRGNPIVMLHGDPTWGYLYRRFIPSLARRFRCIVPDHLGMGKSDVPARPSWYHLGQHIASLETLLLGLDLRDITLVVHDWGGPVGLGFAVRHPERIERLIVLNSWAFVPWPGGAFPRLIEIIRSERGEAFVLKRNGYVEPAILGTTNHRERLSDEVLRAYRAPFSTPESRLATLCWSRDIPVVETDRSYHELEQIEANLSRFVATPTLLIWGMLDPVHPPTVLQRWQTVFPQATTREIADASHFLQEDAPEQIVELIEEFLRE